MYTNTELQNIFDAYAKLQAAEGKKASLGGRDTPKLDRIIQSRKNYLRKRGLSADNRKQLSQEIAELKEQQSFGCGCDTPCRDCTCQTKTETPTSPKQKPKFKKNRPQPRHASQ